MEVHKPWGLKFINVFGSVCIDDKGRRLPSSLLFFHKGLSGSFNMAVSTMLIPGPRFCTCWHGCQHVPQAEVIKWASHPPLSFVDRLTLLLAASEVSPDGGIFIHWPYRPRNRSKGNRIHQHHRRLGGGLTLNYPSHGLWLIGVTEELIVLPIIEVEIGAISLTPFWLLMGALGGPSDGGLITGALPQAACPSG
jgi:hypothetical protein